MSLQPPGGQGAAASVIQQNNQRSGSQGPRQDIGFSNTTNEMINAFIARAGNDGSKTGTALRSGSRAAVPSATDDLIKLQQKIIKQNNKGNELDEEILAVQAEILHQKKLMNGIQPHEKHQKLLKDIRNLEFRLDKSNQRYNHTVANNTNLRGEIDKLRRERKIFQQVYTKLSDDLDSKKQEMNRIVKIANNANTDREQATNELMDLIKQAEEEKMQFDQQIQLVNQKIEKEKQMKEFMKAKEAEQSELEKLYKQTKEEEEVNLNKQSQKAFFGFSKDKVTCLIAEEKLKEYQESFDKILQATGAKNIDELVSNFIEAEERNFTLSKYVNELTQENEQLDQDIAQMKKKIEWYRNQGLGEDNERKKQQKELEQQIHQSESEYQKNIMEYKATIEKINQIKVNIEEIFSLVDNDTSRKFKELQKSHGLTQDNIMMYLGMIEDMINEMIKQYAYLLAQKIKQAKSLDDDDPVIVTLNNILMIAPKVEGGQRYDQMTVKDEIAKEEDEISLQDDEDKPLTQDDFNKICQIKYAMNKKEKK